MHRYRGVVRSIELAEDKVPEHVQLFRAGTFYHPSYGAFKIESKDLAEMVKNFKAGIRGVDLAIDYKHDNDDIAAGWIKDLELRNNGTELWALVDWTPKGSQVVGQKEFRYLSPEFTYKYQDNESLNNYGPTLLGAGLTNRPTIKNMEPVCQLQESDPLQQCVAGLVSDLVSQGHDQEQAVAIAYSKCRKELGLSDGAQPKKEVLKMDYKAMDPAALEQMSPDELKAMIMELMKKLEALEGDKLAVEKKAGELEAEKKLVEKRTAFAKLLSEGKVCKAQEDSYISGDILKFSELAESVKLTEVGSGKAPAAKEAVTKEEAETKILTLAHAKVAEKQAKDLGEAVSMVLKENKQLHDLVRGN